MLGPDRIVPYGVETLARTAKSWVVRMKGAGVANGDVVAKRRRRLRQTERRVYEHVLQRLSVPALHYHGWLQHGELSWLFVEYAGPANYRLGLAEHRIAAARWVAALHTGVAQDSIDVALPDRGTSYYWDLLISGRGNIQDALGDRTLRADQRQILEAIIRTFGEIAELWHDVVRYCDSVPRVLVHGDLATKNVRVRSNSPEVAFVAFDWETAGWGQPATDLAQFALSSVSPDITTYWKIVRTHWPHLDLNDVRRLAELGGVLRLVAGIAWESWSLGTIDRDTVVDYVAGIHERLRAALGACGWLRS